MNIKLNTVDKIVYLLPGEEYTGLIGWMKDNLADWIEWKIITETQICFESLTKNTNTTGPKVWPMTIQ